MHSQDTQSARRRPGRWALGAALLTLGLGACAEIVPEPDGGSGGTGAAGAGGAPLPPIGGGVDAAVRPLDARVGPPPDRALPPEPQDQGSAGDAWTDPVDGAADGPPDPAADRGPGADAAGPDAAGPDAAGPPDAGPPDAGACGVEICNGLDDDCDGAIDEDAGCPCPVSVHAGRPYLICSARVPWTDARVACQAVGYDLAVILSADENDHLYDQINAAGFLDTWIGLNDRAVEGRWVWLDGLPLGYQRWDSGEPNNGGGGEDCGVLMTSRNRTRRWDDRPCGRTQPFLCGIPPIF